jgi:hypothetical protein
MRQFNLYKFFISSVILLFSFLIAFNSNIFGNLLRDYQIFTIALLCGWSIRELWSNEYN